MVMHFRVWVSDTFEISVKHTRHWYLKDPPLPGLVDFGLLDALIELVIPYPTLSTTLVNSSQTTPGDGVVDLTSGDDDEE